MNILPSHTTNGIAVLSIVLFASEFHITLECPIVISLWTQIEPILQNIEHVPVADQEKVFGLPGTTKPILLRNWITFALRSCIVSQENIAFHNKRGKASEIDIKKIKH